MDEDSTGGGDLAEQLPLLNFSSSYLQWSLTLLS